MLKQAFVYAFMAVAATQAHAQTKLSDYMPPNQKRFISIAGEYADKYQAADNELKKSAIWKERTKKLREALTSKPGEKKSDWVGFIDEMGTTGSGNAWVVLRITPGITIATWNNEFSDISDKTLIKNGSPTYNALAELKKGAVVYFDCVLKTEGKGLLEEGRMLDPSFLARIKSIKPLPGASAGK